MKPNKMRTDKFIWRNIVAALGCFILVAFLLGMAKNIKMQYIMSEAALMHDILYSETEDNSYYSLSNIMALDSKQSSYEGLYGEISDKNKIVKQLEGVKQYVSITLGTDLDRIAALADETPLNLQESAILLGYCEKMDLKPSIILGLIETESNFKKYSVGTSQDRGYMQIIPGTEKWLANRYGYRLNVRYDSSKIFEPEYNFALGIIYLNHLKRFQGEDYHKILSEYNRGPYNLKKYYNKHKTYQTSYSILILKRAAKYERFDLQELQ
jgi:hypothetical protein